MLNIFPTYQTLRFTTRKFKFYSKNRKTTIKPHNPTDYYTSNERLNLLHFKLFPMQFEIQLAHFPWFFPHFFSRT